VRTRRGAIAKSRFSAVFLRIATHRRKRRLGCDFNPVQPR
jgi:hypothetical protein